MVKIDEKKTNNLLHDSILSHVLILSDFYYYFCPNKYDIIYKLWALFAQKVDHSTSRKLAQVIATEDEANIIIREAVALLLTEPGSIKWAPGVQSSVVHASAGRLHYLGFLALHCSCTTVRIQLEGLKGTAKSCLLYQVDSTSDIFYQ